MEVGMYIRTLRNDRGLTQEELGNLVGVQKAAVQKWESGAVKNLKRGTIKKLAEIFNVNPVSFIGESNSAPREPSNVVFLDSQNIYNVPVFDSVSAGFGAYADESIVDYIPLYITNPADVADTIAIHVKGNSMYPKIEDGDTIVVRRQSSVDSGDVAVVLIDGDEAVVKRVEYDKDSVTLLSFNPEYEPKKFVGEDLERLKVVGLVKQVVKTL